MWFGRKCFVPSITRHITTLNSISLKLVIEFVHKILASNQKLVSCLTCTLLSLFLRKLAVVQITAVSMFDTDDIIYRSASKRAPQRLITLLFQLQPVLLSEYTTALYILQSAGYVYAYEIHQFMFIYETLPCLPPPYPCHLWPTTPAANNTHPSLLKDQMANSVFGESSLILTESS